MGPAAGMGAGGGDTRGAWGADGELATAPTVAPHITQNAASGSRGAPQEGQIVGPAEWTGAGGGDTRGAWGADGELAPPLTVAPHITQKAASGSRGELQFGQTDGACGGGAIITVVLVPAPHATQKAAPGSSGAPQFEHLAMSLTLLTLVSLAKIFA